MTNEEQLTLEEKWIDCLKENTKLKEQVEQLRATISKMETTAANEDDLKQCYSCEFATKQTWKRIKGKVVRVTDKN